MAIIEGDLKKLFEEEIVKKTSISERLLTKIATNLNELSKKVTYDIGDIVASFEDESTFQSLHDIKWVQCNGQNIEGTELSLRANLAFAPDMRGHFARQVNVGTTGLDTNRVLNSFQDDEVRSHTHRSFIPFASFQELSPGPGWAGEKIGVNGGMFPGITKYTYTADVPDTGLTGVGGSVESRGVNLAVNFFIKTEI